MKGEVQALHAMADLHTTLKEYSKAKEVMNDAREVCKEAGDI